MALNGVEWPNEIQRRYYELAAGYVSPRFDQILRLIDSAGDGPASSPQPGVTIRFTSATLSGSPLPGVALDVNTGQVTIQSPLPSLPSGQSWPQVMDVTCTASEGTRTFQATARIRVHVKLDRVWLTPTRLTVHKDAKNVRLSLLGQFSDRQIGDLSNWSPVKEPDPSDPSDPTAAADRRFVSLQNGSAPVVAWSASGSGIALASSRTGMLDCTSETASVTVTANVSQSPALTASAKAAGAPAWSKRTLLEPLIPASTLASMPKRRNVLILPEGFDSASRAEFELYAREAIERLGKRLLTRPHDLLKNKFNWFTVWVPSPQSDVPFLDELARSAYTGPPLPLTATPYDGKPYDPTVAGAVQLLANERDTAFHVGIGDRPYVTQEGARTFPGFNPLRMHADDLNAFLFHVTSKPADISHPPEGRTWAEGGNDEKLIVFLCRSTYVGGLNKPWTENGRLVFLTLEDEKLYRVFDDGSGTGYETLPATPDKERAKQSVWLTLAHELCHSLRLGDEYGHRPPPIPDDALPWIRKWANVQLLRDFPGGQLSGSDLKWLWPRAAKAAPYLSLSHPDASGVLTCELSTSYAEQSCKPDRIRPGDEVRLRLRNIFFSSLLSPRLEVVAVENFKIKLRLKSGSPPLQTQFLPAIGSGQPGVMLVIPKGQNGIELNIVHFAIQVHITTGVPLNAAPGASWTCRPADLKDLAAPTNLPTTTPPTKWPLLRSWIVGAFEGGHNFSCEIYHPTGECVMLDSAKAKQFCHVCRYALVDQIDPLKHGAIDRDFDKQYPK